MSIRDDTEAIGAMTERLKKNTYNAEEAGQILGIGHAVDLRRNPAWRDPRRFAWRGRVLVPKVALDRFLSDGTIRPKDGALELHEVED